MGWQDLLLEYRRHAELSPVLINCIVVLHHSWHIRVHCNALYPQEGWTPLLSAVLAGHMVLVSILLKSGAKANNALPVSTSI